MNFYSLKDKNSKEHTINLEQVTRITADDENGGRVLFSGDAQQTVFLSSEVLQELISRIYSKQNNEIMIRAKANQRLEEQRA